MAGVTQGSTDLVVTFYDAFDRCDLSGFDETLARDWDARSAYNFARNDVTSVCYP